LSAFILVRQNNMKLSIGFVALALLTTIPVRILAAPASSAPNDRRLAQLFYPPASERPVVAVTGQGYASLPADTANVEITLTNRNPQERENETPNKPGKAKPAPLTEAALASIVNALKAEGIPAQKIKVVIDPLQSRSGRYGSPSDASNATMKVVVDKPTTESIDRLAKVVNTATARKTNIYVEGATVQYVVNSCKAVEDAAYLSAVQDAKMRADALAKAMGVQLADGPSVAELPFLGRLYSPCTQTRDVTGAIFSRTPGSYSPGAPAEVGIYREISVTYRTR
jgi:uncharacterized protein YggE